MTTNRIPMRKKIHKSIEDKLNRYNNLVEHEIESQKKEIQKLKEQIRSMTENSPADTKTFFSAQMIYDFRTELGISRNVFAEIIGVTGGTIYSWEKNKTRPQAIFHKRLVKVFEMPRNEIYEKIEVSSIRKVGRPRKSSLIH